MTKVKRSFFASAVLVCAVILAGCAGAPVAPAPQEPAAAEAAPAAAAAAIPNLEFTQQVVRYSTIAEYEAATGNKITAFQQSPMLDALVADGTLPPVEERLPSEPLVLQPADQIGEYGGTMINGHEGNFDFLEDLLREFPNTYSSNMQGAWPNVFMSTEISDDGRTFTFKTRPGMKWSDGHPFGADDFVFWYEAIALNTDLNPSGVNNLKVGGEMGTVSKVDDNTIVMSFAAPYGILPVLLNRWREVPYAPAHYMKQFHPGYTDPAAVDAIVKERGFTTWVELWESELNWYGNPDIPTIFAWKTLTRGASVAVQELERNPYYWKVDPAGNQLPYVDRVHRPNLGDQQAILLSVLSGENDYMDPYSLGYITNYPVLKQTETQGLYRILPQYGWSDVLGTITFNMSIDDPVLRELFNNKDFRIALSIAYDREEINDVVFNGLYTPSQMAPPDESVYNGADPAFKQNIEHDPDRANEILDGLGLTWNSDRTQRLLPDGRPFELGALLNTGWVQHAPIAELIAQGWQDVGLKVILQPQGGDLLEERMLAGDYQLTILPVNWGGAAPIIAARRCDPIPNCAGWPINPKWGQWMISGGSEGEEPPQDVKRLYEISQEFVAATTDQERFDLEKEMYDIHNNNMWMIGSIKQPGNLEAVWYSVFSKRMYNIPNPVAPEWYYAVPSTWSYRAE